MKTITKQVNLYDFDELSDDAKENVRQQLIEDGRRNDIYYEDCKEDLYNNFANSNLDLQYSLSYCQGDGLNIFGQLHLMDFLPLFNCTEKEKRTLLFYFSKKDYITLSKNFRYCFSKKDTDKTTVYYDYLYDISHYDALKNVNRGLVSRFIDAIMDYFKALESRWEDNGYSYIYYQDDYDLADEVAANGYEFLADGTIYA